MWKYKVTAIDKDWSPLELERYLNDFCATWELVAVDRGRLILKRPIAKVGFAPVRHLGEIPL